MTRLKSLYVKDFRSIDGEVNVSGIGGAVPTALLMARQARLQGLIVGSRRHQLDFVRGLGRPACIW